MNVSVNNQTRKELINGKSVANMLVDCVGMYESEKGKKSFARNCQIC